MSGHVPRPGAAVNAGTPGARGWTRYGKMEGEGQAIPFKEGTMSPTRPAAAKTHVEEVELQGHIIDSLILPKVLDEILTRGGTYVMKDIRLGTRQVDPSYAKIEVRAPSAGLLDDILDAIHDHGAVPIQDSDCTVERADMDGAFPEGFYSTTNYRTEIRLGGEWVEVGDQEMDCGVLVDPKAKTARTVAMARVRRGDPIV